MASIKIAPSTVHLDVCLVNVPAPADPPCTPPPEVIDEGRCQLRLPIANRLIAEFDAPDQEHLWQIAQAQLVAKPPKDHECYDVGWILSAIENSTAAFIELLTTGAAPEASVTPGRLLTSFRHVRRLTLYTPHCTGLHPGRIIARRAFTPPANPGAKGDRTRLPSNASAVPARATTLPDNAARRVGVGMVALWSVIDWVSQVSVGGQGRVGCSNHPPGRHVMTCNLATRQYMPYMAYMTLIHDKVFQMRATDEFLRRVDDWRRQQPELPSRAEAIRRLIEAGLRAETAPAPKAAGRKKAGAAKP